MVYMELIPNAPEIVYFLFLSFFFKILLYFTLQYCIGFAIHQHKSTMGVHKFPLLNPPSHLPLHAILYRFC